MRALVVAFALAFAAPALADVAPPNQCSNPGEACDTAGPGYDAPGVCEKQTCSRTLPGPNGPETHSYDCNLCVPKRAAAEPPAPAKAEKDGSGARKSGACSVGDGPGRGPSGSPALVGLALAVGLVAGSRRRR